MATFMAELVERAPLSSRVQRLSFLAAQPFPRAGGQYVTLTLDEGSKFAFSVASPFEPQAPKRFEIAVTCGTTATGLLELELGGLVSVSGPSGALVWKADAPALLVATGTGIAPLRAIVHEQLARGTGEPLALLFGCRDPSEELWGAEFSRLAEAHPRLRYWPTHTQPRGAPVARVGRVQAYLPEAVRALGPGLRAYLCGHTPMVQDCAALLLEQGVPAEHVHGESY